LSVVSYTVVPLETVVSAFLALVVNTGGINLDVAFTVLAVIVLALPMLLLFIVIAPPILRVDRVPRLAKLLDTTPDPNVVLVKTGTLLIL
jgi:hypothetical protein